MIAVRVRHGRNRSRGCFSAVLYFLSSFCNWGTTVPQLTAASTAVTPDNIHGSLFYWPKRSHCAVPSVGVVTELPALHHRPFLSFLLCLLACSLSFSRINIIILLLHVICAQSLGLYRSSSICIFAPSVSYNIVCSTPSTATCRLSLFLRIESPLHRTPTWHKTTPLRWPS